MAASPYAKLLASVNGAPPKSGAVICPIGSTIQLSSDSILQTKTLYEILAYPKGWQVPAGWTLQSNGTISFAGLTPPPFTVGGLGIWGKWRSRLTVEDGLNNGVADSTRVDTKTAISVPSLVGFKDLASGETNQFGKDWTSDHQDNLRLTDAVLFALASRTVPFGPAITSTSSSFVLASQPLDGNSITVVDAYVSAIQHAAGGGPNAPDFAYFKLSGVWGRDAGGAPIQKRAPTVVDSAVNANDAPWTAVLALNGTVVEVRVTGGAGKTVTWTCVLSLPAASLLLK